MKLFCFPPAKIIAVNANTMGRMENAQTRSIYKTCTWCAAYGADAHTERRERMNKEREVDKITLHYDDGTEKTVEKGFICNMKEENGEAVLEFTMCHVPGREIKLIIEGCLQLGFKLGMFKEEE